MGLRQQLQGHPWRQETKRRAACGSLAERMFTSGGAPLLRLQFVLDNNLIYCEDIVKLLLN